MQARDPWLWTVDDLVDAIGNLFKQAACEDEDIPDATDFAAYLRTQQMTGAKFLTVSEAHTLGHEAAFSQYGQQNTVNSVVQLLRNNSSIYQQHVANTAADTSDYNIQLSLPSNNTSVSVISHDQPNQRRANLVQVTQGYMNTDLQSIAAPVGEQPPVAESQWAHLLRWSNFGGHDEVDPETSEELDGIDYDEIEGYEEDDNDDHELNDVHDEAEPVRTAEETGPGRNKLSKDQIVDVINHCIEKFTESWSPNKEVLKEDQVDYDPEKMWLQAEAAQERPQKIAQHEAEVAYFSQRLDVLCERIMDFPAGTVEKLRKQASNLELTVYSLELAKWLLSIYQLEPEQESDDETISNESRASTPAELQVISGDLQSYQSKVHMQTIYLGSPSTSSRGDAMDIDDFNYLIPSPRPTERNPGDFFVKTGPSYPTEVQDSSILSVQGWQWADLISTRDRKRVVSKTIHEMGDENRELIRHRLECLGVMDVAQEISACVGSLVSGFKLRGVLPRDSIKIETVTRLFLSWWFCDNCFQKEISPESLQELAECLNQEKGCADLETFGYYVRTIFSTTFSEEALKYPYRPSQAEVIVISDDDEDMEQTPRKLPSVPIKISPWS